MERSLDEPSSSYGHIAEDYILADDKLSVTYIINEKAKFSNGDAITASDIKFSFETLISKDAHPQYRIYWADIKSTEIINNRVIKFHFNRVNPELHMIIGDIPIFSPKWFSWFKPNFVYNTNYSWNKPRASRVDGANIVSVRRTMPHWRVICEGAGATENLRNVGWTTNAS